MKDEDDKPILITKIPQHGVMVDVDTDAIAMKFRVQYGDGGRRSRQGKNVFKINHTANVPTTGSTTAAEEGADTSNDRIDWDVIPECQRFINHIYQVNVNIDGLDDEAKETIRLLISEYTSLDISGLRNLENANRGGTGGGGRGANETLAAAAEQIDSNPLTV